MTSSSLFFFRTSLRRHHHRRLLRQPSNPFPVPVGADRRRRPSATRRARQRRSSPSSFCRRCCCCSQSSSAQRRQPSAPDIGAERPPNCAAAQNVGRRTKTSNTSTVQTAADSAAKRLTSLGRNLAEFASGVGPVTTVDCWRRQVRENSSVLQRLTSGYSARFCVAYVALPNSYAGSTKRRR